MALSFPSNPVDGSIAILGSNTYRYDSAQNKWVSKRIDNVVQSISVVDSDSLNIQVDGNIVTFTKDLQYSGAVTEKVYTITSLTETLNASNGTIQVHVLDSDVTYYDGLTNGQGLTMMITNEGGYNITWPEITWATNSGNAPDTTDTLSIVTIWKIGSTLYGIEAGDAAAGSGTASSLDSDWVLTQMPKIMADSEWVISNFANTSLSALSDVDTTNVVSGAGLVWNGSNWVSNSSSSIVYTMTEYRGFQCYVNRVRGNDPSINQMLICKADQTPTAAYGYTPADTDQDDFFLSGLSNPDFLCAFNIYGTSDAAPLDITTLTNVFHRFVDEVFYVGSTLDPRTPAMSARFSAAYNNLLSDAGGSSAVKTDFEYYISETVYLIPPGGQQNDSFTATHWTVISGSNQTLTSYSVAVDVNGYTSTGMGYTGSYPNMTIVITGDKLGGTTPENDLTVVFDGSNDTPSGTPANPVTPQVPTNFIEDGSDDQYDDGNYIGTDAFLNDYHTNENYDGIPYNDHNETLGSAYFGGDAVYNVNYEPGMWVMFATSSVPMTATKFGYIGNLGSDGGGEKDITTVYGSTAVEVLNIPKPMDSDWILRQIPTLPEDQYDSEWVIAHTQATIAKTLGEWVDSDFVTDAINNIVIPEVQADSEWMLAQLPTILDDVPDVNITNPNNGDVLVRNQALGFWFNRPFASNVQNIGTSTNADYSVGLTIGSYGPTYYGTGNLLQYNPSSATLKVAGETITPAKIQAWDAAGGGSSLSQSVDQDVAVDYTVQANQTAETFDVFSFDITQYTGGKLELSVVDDQRIYNGEYTVFPQNMTVDFACIKDMGAGFLGDNACNVSVTKGTYVGFQQSYVNTFSAVVSGTTVTIRATTSSNLNYAGLDIQITGKATLIKSRVA